MPALSDFRTAAFDAAKVDACGKQVGRTVYWKLYSVENLMRVMIHSVLSAQVGAHWWNIAVDPRIQQRAQRFRTAYARQPWHSHPGIHDLYYTQLPDLSEILRANSHLFQPVIPDIDSWIARIEQIRLPRNIVGHMNWPSTTDRQRIDVIFSDVQALVSHLAQSGLVMTIP